MIRFLILVGYFELTMYLHLSGKLDQYINLHYSYLAYISMVLSFILALVQLYLWMKKRTRHNHLKSWSTKLASLLLLSLPLLVGLFFPTVSLDSTTVAAKGFHFPLAEGSSKEVQADEGTTNQYLKPDTSTYFTKGAYEKEMRAAEQKYLGQGLISVTTDNYMEFMEVLYDYPEEFVGKELELTGFVYNDPSNPSDQFLFRFGIIHCIADSGVYGLLTTGNKEQFPDNSWVHAKGVIKLTYHKELKQSLPTLEVESFQKVEKPDNPYVYRVF